MSNSKFSKYPFWLDQTGWNEELPAKSNNTHPKVRHLSSPIILKRKFLDPATRVEMLVITDDKRIERTEQSDILTSQKLPSLIKYGFNINESYTKRLCYALQLMRESIELSEYKKGVGVLNSDNGIIISLDAPYFSKEVEQNLNNEIVCDIQYDLNPKGSFYDWYEMYQNEVKGNLLLELAVTFSASSLVTAFLKCKHEVEFAGTIFSFTGNSSTGKSTAAALAVSIAGNPTKGNKTLFRSWNGTRNALEGYLSHNHGVPIVLDELSAATFRDTTGLLYSIAEGQGRQRSNINGEVKTPKNWGTTVISTSEYSIFNDAAQNDGLRVRTIEISEPFTKDAKNSDAIKKAISLNYGHVMPLIADYLLKREQEILNWFNKEHQFFSNALKNETNNTGIRMFKRYAVITISAKILSRVLATPINISEVRNYLIKYHHESVVERSLADKAIEVIIQFVAQNRSKFSDSNTLSLMIENYGLINLKEDHIEVKIISKIFKNMMAENQFQDTNNVIDALREKGFIQSDRDRKTTKRSVKDSNGKKHPIVFYHLKLDKSYESILNLRPDNSEDNNRPNPFIKHFAKDQEFNNDLEF